MIEVVCPRCHGKGTIVKFDFLDESETYQSMDAPCPKCGGRGFIKFRRLKL